MTGICINVVYITLTENLNMNKVCACWVPRLLQQDQKAAHVRLSRSFLNCYDREGDQFLHRIVMMDDEPESKQQSMVWKHPGSPLSKKVRTCKSSGKFMFLMGAHGLILQHAVPQGTTVNAAYYQKVLTAFEERTSWQAFREFGSSSNVSAHSAWWLQESLVQGHFQKVGYTTLEMC